MVDIDHFKRVNDTYGHATGDEVIRTVAERLAGQIRGTDLLGRYGGEEFACLLVDTDDDVVVPERLRACVAESPVQTQSGPLAVTVSIGVAHLCPEDGHVGELLARADQAFYEAKRVGRSRVIAA
jgi:diguanylate cyclase (GGDEF)-like protein